MLVPAPPLLASSASASSRKIIDRAASRATANRVRSNFSPSPFHLLVSAEAVQEKSTHLLSFAAARTSIVFPWRTKGETPL